mmetsp:Transcript_17174/g.30110  ORF Transcript_17174/g.30110 Transcript_17174/m.30110 type:complete len:641 (-) Transcript_17174:169-2091(-)|eukprot:CAMPEP_0197644808 /NCGR_PEP_ID=MMETSP1338-20131121/17664_1 /TAXON_ID=43686 ORGANISM="Pelagodinium beii, Strain RCC1491" /NCGR_SAMPLE_ID=MMETSP1338 /ASSEMBLY_ACC=CAM_ASM_000754 /LENGTH=640 /DNA_ID=CAMNT_0043218267 /DNA_START=29 /DNA_END=1951 /DNA_ORIENTATION=+
MSSTNESQTRLLENVPEEVEKAEQEARQAWDSTDWRSKALRFMNLPHDEEVENMATELAKKIQAEKDKLLDVLQRKTGDVLQKQTLEEKQKTWEEKVNACKAFQAFLQEQVTPQRFVAAVTVLRSKTPDFLRSLSVSLSTDQWPSEWSWLQREEETRSSVALFAFPDWETISKNEGPEEWVAPPRLRDAMWKMKAVSGKRYPWFNFVSSSYSAFAENEVHWLPLQTIVEAENQGDGVRILKALHNIGPESGVFDTAVGWAILHRSWQSNETLFWIYRFLDFFYICSLAAIVYFTVYNPRPLKVLRWSDWTWWVLIFSSMSSLRAALWPVIEIVGMRREFGCREGTMLAATFWNVTIFLFECISAMVMGILLVFEFVHRKNCREFDVSHPCGSVFVKHPVIFSLVVGGRWFYFILSLMCTSTFGSHVFPAWHAMTRPASLAFIAFLFITVIAALHTYLIFPIDENNPFTGASQWIAFMKVFKIALLGDFDVWELEGVDPVVEGTVRHSKGTKSGLNGQIDDGEPSAVYNDGVMLFSMVITVTVSILSMNVAIGVVSSLYDEAKSKANQIHSHFRAGYLFKLMMQRHIFGKCCCGNSANESGKGSFVISILKEKPSTEEQQQKKMQELQDKMEQLIQTLSSK